MPCRPREPSCIDDATLRKRFRHSFMSYIAINGTASLMSLSRAMAVQCPPWFALALMLSQIDAKLQPPFGAR